ncbi:MAG: hypothetical protein GY866_18235 [Proteobacteria bacterium]|nr:hypothetical protein [Pseudomonadota bacterium]
MARVNLEFLEELEGRSTQDEKAALENQRKDAVSREEIHVYSVEIGDVSPESASAFMEVCGRVGAELGKKEFKEWVAHGKALLAKYPDSPDFCAAYFRSCARFLSKQTASFLEGWVGQGQQIAEYSLDTATLFFQATALFLEHERYYHVREWAGRVKQILALGAEYREVANTFLESSAEILRLKSFRELKHWGSAGIKLARISAATALDFFSLVPEGMGTLYQSEMRKVFELTALIAKARPGQALEFYRDCPSALLALNPNVRESVLDIVHKNAFEKPERTAGLFSEIVTAVRPLFYPVQEMVMKHEAVIENLSPKASRAYFQNVGELLEEVHESFLPYWVEKGCSLLGESEQSGIDYFSFASEASQREYRSWKQAIFLDDHKDTLALFAQALTGRVLRLQNTETLDVEETSSARQHPAHEAHVIYLPPVFAEEESRGANFRQYKVATAHQSGYIEFKTFERGFPAMRAALEALTHSELALDIFFIVEDGRIDYNLRKEYAGLRRDLDATLDLHFRKRPYPDQVPLREGLEILLRLTVGRLDENRVSSSLAEHLLLLKQSLDGFYQRARNVGDSFAKTMEIYELLSRLLADDEYLPLIPVAFREIPDLDLYSDKGPGDEVPDKIVAGDEEGGAEGQQLSEEEIKKLIELMNEAELTEPLKKGKGDQGLFLADLDALIAAGAEDETEEGSRMSDKAPAMPSVSQAVSKRGPFFYDEWDYLQKSYRRKWCCLREIEVTASESGLFDAIYKNYSDLIKKVKKQFQRIRPDVLDPVRRVEWGSEIDFNAMIESVVDRKAGDTPSDRIFARKERKIRRISTLLLVDMSASTDRLASSVTDSTVSRRAAAELTPSNANLKPENEKKIIDIERESLVVMTEALEALDDDYAVFGFSGYGREQVDFYAVKDFDDNYSEDVKNRICGIKPQKSTRMGAVIRHAVARLKPLDSDHRLLIMLSDGYPQDMNYGEDRTSQEYALHDTMMALIEARKLGIKPFCITVDQCGDDYLRKMCDPASYLVIKDIYTLPQVLPKVVEALVG